MLIEPVPEDAPITPEEWAKMSRAFRRWTVELAAGVKARMEEVAALRSKVEGIRADLDPAPGGDVVAGQPESAAEKQHPAG
jgi:hypothetical protein